MAGLAVCTLPCMKLRTFFLSAALLALVPACSNAAATCQADCELRVDSCPSTAVNCEALCNTYIGLGDSGGCSDERLLYQNCVVDASCTDGCAAEYAGLRACVGANSNAPCLTYCRSREAVGCGQDTCAGSCIDAEYVGRAAGCEAEVDLWVSCLTTGSQCDADSRCLSLYLDALGCAGDYCRANPDDPACP